MIDKLIIIYYSNHMGNAVTASRKVVISHSIDEHEKEIQASWRKNNEFIFPCNGDKSYSSPEALHIAGAILKKSFPKTGNVLEIMAGNCVASGIIKPYIDHEKWICTDLFAPSEELDAIEAVEKYGEWADTLMIISPPPYCQIDNENFNGGYGDYFACKKIIEKANRNKFIIILGELGAGDGTEGIYRYLLEHPKLKLMTREQYWGTVSALTGKIIREVFIFKIDL